MLGCVPSTVWSVGSRAGEPRRAWADSRHPSCFVSLLFNRLLYKRLVVCFTQEPQQKAAAQLQKAQLKVLQRKCPGQGAAVQRAREAWPRQVPGAPELCSQVLDSCKSLRFQGNHICLVGGSLAEFKRKLRVVRECCCNHWKCNYFKVLGHELVEMAG